MMDEEDNEVAFRPEPEESVPPTPITTVDMDVIIRGWEEKFAKLTECLREVQLAMERTGSDMCLVNQEARAQGQEQERRLGSGDHAGRPRGLPAKVREHSNHATC